MIRRLLRRAATSRTAARILGPHMCEHGIPRAECDDTDTEHATIREADRWNPQPSRRHSLGQP